MSFHSQNSSVGFWISHNRYNITIEVFSLSVSLNLSIATISLPNKDNIYLGPWSDLNWCFNKSVKYIDSLTITHLSHFLLQRVQKQNDALFRDAWLIKVVLNTSWYGIKNIMRASL